VHRHDGHARPEQTETVQLCLPLPLGAGRVAGVPDVVTISYTLCKVNFHTLLC
jgi:hypothetical protein